MAMESQPLLRRPLHSVVPSAAERSRAHWLLVLCLGCLLLAAATLRLGRPQSLRATLPPLLRHRSTSGAVVESRPGNVSAQVVLERNGRFRVMPYVSGEVLPIAYGAANYTRNVSGWGYLSVRGSPPTSGDFKSYLNSMKAMGYLEGYLTCAEMREWYSNFYSGLFDGGDPSDETMNFLQDNYDWMSLEADKHYTVSEYWLKVQALLYQLEGLLDGVLDGYCNNYSFIQYNG